MEDWEELMIQSMFLSMSKCNGQTALEYNATRNSYILTMVPEVLVFILSKRKKSKDFIFNHPAKAAYETNNHGKLPNKAIFRFRNYLLRLT